MISETDIVSGYMWILGRVPGQAEIARCRAHFAQPLDDVVQLFRESLLQSEEFRERRLLMHRARGLQRPGLDDDRLAFVHVEKCGGTTLHEMLRTQFAPGRVCPERFASIGDWTVNELAGFGLFSGHFDLSYCRSIPGRVRALTLLREPGARLWSLYRFWKSHRPHPDRDLYDLILLAREHDAEAFFSLDCVRRHSALRDGIAGQLTRTRPEWLLPDAHPMIADPVGMLDRARTALEGMAGFGILERFDESRALLNRQLGLDMPAVPPRQVLSEMVLHSDELVALPPEPITPAVRALLDEMTTVDRPLYAWACRVFEQRLAEAGLTAASPAAVARVAPEARRGRPFGSGWRRLAGGMAAKARRAAP